MRRAADPSPPEAIRPAAQAGVWRAAVAVGDAAAVAVRAVSRARWQPKCPTIVLTHLASGLVVAMLASACGDQVLVRRAPEKPEDVVLLVDEDAGVDKREITTDAHAVLGVAPTHGTFAGGTLAVIRGNGFTDEARVWFGDHSIDPDQVTAIDPNRIQVVVPPGSPGPADVTVQIGDDESTRRQIDGGYTYDPFAVEPAVGSTSGGTLITLIGFDTDWDDSTEVLIDLEPCEVVEVRQPKDGLQELDCRTPAGTPGQKVVSVSSGTKDPVSVTGGFAYSESATNFEGGLSGRALDDVLQITVLDDLFGEPLGGATVFLDGAGSEPEWLSQTDDAGRVSFAGKLGPRRMVTVAGPCIQPLTVVDVPVDTLTLYVAPILTPDCLPPNFDIPRFGGSAGAAILNRVSGELSWGQGIELKRKSWRNVPPPADDTEEQVAYVLELASSTRSEFQLPSRVNIVTPTDQGALGYGFDFETRSTGNLTLYALAGIERSVARGREFTPYVMGVVKGVDPTDAEARPIIAMDIVLDHSLLLDVTPPPIAKRGPDRMTFDVFLRVGRSGYIPLPQTRRTLPLPIGDQVRFSGLPALAKALTGAQYVVSATGVTGVDEGYPVADIEALATRSTDKALPVGGFIEVPRLLEPAPDGVWDGRRLSTDPDIEGQFDLWTFNIDAGNGSFHWRIVAPRNRAEVELPDLTVAGARLPTSAATIRTSAARVSDFDYGTLPQRGFGTGGWAAYSADVAQTIIE